MLKKTQTQTAVELLVKSTAYEHPSIISTSLPDGLHIELFIPDEDVQQDVKANKGE